MTRRPQTPPPKAEDLSAELRVTFGANFRAARIAVGISQQEVAAKTGMGQGQISRIESGATNITFDTATKLAAAVGADVRDLLGLYGYRRKGAGKGRPGSNNRA